MIYFVSNGEAIKIGRSDNVSARMAALAVGAPRRLELLATVDGSAPHEARVHADLVKYRLNGEWFSDCPTVRSAIDRYTACGIDPVRPAVRPTSTTEIVKKCRGAGWILMAKYEREGVPKMEAYELVAADVGTSAGWLRKFLSGYSAAKDPKLSVGYSLLSQAAGFENQTGVGKPGEVK